MTEYRENLEEVWQYVAVSDGSSRALPSRPINIHTATGPVRVALEPGDVRHLLVPVRRRGDVVSDRRSRGVVVVPQDLEMDGERTWFADLVCVEQRLVDVYTRLAGAVCETIEADPELAGSAPAKILDEWRELLSIRKSALSREAAVGLFGELTFLTSAVDAAGAAVLASWLGPEGHQHDFASKDIAVEVKATTRREGRRVEIHGIGQLATSAEIALYLAFIRLNASPEGQTIAELLRGLSNRGVSYTDLLTRMQKVGYQPGEEMDQVRYKVKDFDIYEVTSAFPAITPDSFAIGPPRGVESVRYTVDLTAAGSPVDDSGRDAIFRGLIAQ